MAPPTTDVPLKRSAVDEVLRKKGIDLTYATIREMVAIVAEIEKRLECRFLRMEFGIPGLEPNEIARRAEEEALRTPRYTATYPPTFGLAPLKEAGSRFLKDFLNLPVSADHVIPTVGSMQGGFLTQAVAGRRYEKRDRILFVDPCFSVHRMQCRFLGLREASVDLYEREKWLDRVEELCGGGEIGGILYSSPNNPTWVVLTDGELKRLGEICTKHDVVAIEDAAYFGMDFRRDFSQPGRPPYPPTVARHTDNWVILLSASKIFSYAGQRVALAVLSPGLSAREFPGLEKYFGYRKFHDAFVMSALYCCTSGASVTPQAGLAALLNAACDGKVNFVKDTHEYADRAVVMKKTMLENGFYLVYDKDLDQPLSDGFYFTFGYPKMTSGELLRELLYYGISATTLAITRSQRKDALRACTSLISKSDLPLFESRIRAFRRDHPA